MRSDCELSFHELSASKKEDLAVSVRSNGAECRADFTH